MSLIRKLIPALAFLGCVFILPAATASAAREVSIGVSPTSINSTIAIGDGTSESVTLQNLSADEIAVNIHPGAGGGPGEPAVVTDPGQISLRPGASAQVSIHITVPDDAPPGQWHGAVLFDAASAAERDVSIVGQVGVAVDLDLIRPVTEVSWNLPHLIDSSEPAVFGMAGRNTGNFTTALQGEADIRGNHTWRIGAEDFEPADRHR